MLGNKDAQTLGPHRHDAPTHAWLEGYLKRPSLYDEFLKHLSRRGFAVPPERLERDWSQPYERHAGVMAVFKRVYEDTERYWDEYEMCEKLVDLEAASSSGGSATRQNWWSASSASRWARGSSRVTFLKAALELTFFPELWDVRTEPEAR